MQERSFDVIVIGGGHAGVEAAWAAANLLHGRDEGAVALVTQDPARIGVMSCNPAIGGLAKGQLVREIDALGGLMGLAADATGIQFKVLNQSKGPAVYGPRAQCDKHAYAEAVQRMLAARSEICVLAGTVEDLLVEHGAIHGVRISGPDGSRELRAQAVVLTTGTFMRALMHEGENKTPGGRYGEAPAVGIAASLARLGFELGRLKTGTPPRLRRGSIRWEELPPQYGDTEPTPFSELSGLGRSSIAGADGEVFSSLPAFPVLPQVECRQTQTCGAAHELIRANLHRAPMYSGQIESSGPRYCPSIEDKVVRFAERESHGVFLEPESLRDDWVYCNGISTSLPRDVQDAVVRSLPGCENAEILRYGYAVEYDMVRPHQILATGETRKVRGLFLAGQINGTSGYEEAAAQGLVAGLNAALRALDRGSHVFERSDSYIGVLMDDLVTKTPVEPYRMFTSRAEHRLILRADNAPERLTPVAKRLGLLGGELGALRLGAFQRRGERIAGLRAACRQIMVEGEPLWKAMLRGGFGVTQFLDSVREQVPMLMAEGGLSRAAAVHVFSDRLYSVYAERERAEIERRREMEHRKLPDGLDYHSLPHLRTEAKEALGRYRPATFGQAGRLEGITPADLTLLAVLVQRWKAGGGSGGRAPVGGAA